MTHDVGADVSQSLLVARIGGGNHEGTAGLEDLRDTLEGIGRTGRDHYLVGIDAFEGGYGVREGNAVRVGIVGELVHLLDEGLACRRWHP